MAALRQVFGFVLLVVGLSLKGDVAVGIAFHGQPHKPFYKIEDVEEDEAEFFHLRRVNALMIYQMIGNVDTMMHQHETKNVDCREPLERNEPVA